MQERATIPDSPASAGSKRIEADEVMSDDSEGEVASDSDSCGRPVGDDRQLEEEGENCETGTDEEEDHETVAEGNIHSVRWISGRTLLVLTGRIFTVLLAIFFLSAPLLPLELDPEVSAIGLGNFVLTMNQLLAFHQDRAKPVTLAPHFLWQASEAVHVTQLRVIQGWFDGLTANPKELHDRLQHLSEVLFAESHPKARDDWISFEVEFRRRVSKLQVLSQEIRELLPAARGTYFFAHANNVSLTSCTESMRRQSIISWFSRPHAEPVLSQLLLRLTDVHHQRESDMPQFYADHVRKLVIDLESHALSTGGKPLLNALLFLLTRQFRDRDANREPSSTDPFTQMYSDSASGANVGTIPFDVLLGNVTDSIREVHILRRYLQDSFQTLHNLINKTASTNIMGYTAFHALSDVHHNATQELLRRAFHAQSSTGAFLPPECTSILEPLRTFSSHQLHRQRNLRVRLSAALRCTTTLHATYAAAFQSYRTWSDAFHEAVRQESKRRSRLAREEYIQARAEFEEWLQWWTDWVDRDPPWQLKPVRLLLQGIATVAGFGLGLGRNHTRYLL